MRQEISKTHARLTPAQCRPFVKPEGYAIDQMMTELLPIIGVGFSRGTLDRMVRELSNQSTAMDTIQGLITTASIATPVQFLQNWLPGFVTMITAARKLDTLIGMSTVGNWGDSQIVQQVLELTGTPTPYGDQTLVPYSGWNQNFVTRSVVRFEMGMKVGRLEEYVSAQARVDSASQKRTSCGIQLEIQRNALGFFGYNAGANLTYGFLNDPNLLAYQTVATVGGNTTWAQKTFLQIQGDLLTAFQQLRTQSQDTIDPKIVPLTLAVATNSVDYLSKTSDFGISVTAWMKEAYPNVRVESAPQLNAANGGANVFYLYADKVNDGLSTDDQRSFEQVVPAKFMLLGVSQQTKNYEEDYSNASAGVLAKRPYAVTRWSGI